jgi:adenylosuccinate synthase
MKVDVVLGLSYGDEGKGKICHSLLEKNKYTHVVRFNGGSNAGHTIYHEGKKLVTHLIPSGVFYGVKSLIGPGCVVDVHKFFQELKYLEENGINTKGLVFIAKNAHLVQEIHTDEDSTDTSIGTTRTGNGPCYRDKYARKGLRAEEYDALEPYLIDFYKEFYGQNNNSIKILAEGAQAFHLDIDWGDYPYVTSSHCGLGSVLLNGFNHKHIRNVYGVIKAYDTYVGAKKFQPEDKIFEDIQELGQEFGATTGRKRQCNWLNWDNIEKSMFMNGVNRLVINKVDILDKVNAWNVYYRGKVLNLKNQENFERWICDNCLQFNAKVYFSYSPHGLDWHDKSSKKFESNLNNIDRFLG